MEKLLENWLAVLLFAASFGTLRFALALRKATILEAGKSIMPKWIGYVRIGFIIVSAVLFFVRFGDIADFYLYSIVGIRAGADRPLSVIIFVGIVYLCIIIGKSLGEGLRQKLIWPEVCKFFDNDDIAQKMLQDMERGAQEIRIYSMRVQGLRSFNFDVDGLNRSAYSEDGCIQMAYYLQSKKSGYEMDVCYENDGIELANNSSALRSGKQKYRFSHVILKKE